MRPAREIGARTGRDDGGQTLQTPQRDTTRTGRVAGSDGSVGASANPFGTVAEGHPMEVRAGESWASAAWRATARTSCWPHFRARHGAVDAVPLNGQDIGHLGPNAPRAGSLAAPEERLGHAAAPDMSLTENALLTGASAKSWPARFSRLGRREAFAEKMIADSTCARRAPECRTVAFGRQPAEIRDRARDPAAPDVSGREPADLGRRRCSGGLDPAGAA